MIYDEPDGVPSHYAWFREFWRNGEYLYNYVWQIETDRDSIFGVVERTKYEPVSESPA